MCHNHQAPFDFVAAAFFELYDIILALGPRLGGKTWDFAILSVLESIANDECEGANFGAVEAQAMRCYGYVKRFIEKESDLYEHLKGKITLGKTEFKNNSWLQTLVATFAGMNSPHGQKLKADEVELIPWNILQEAFNIPMSTENIKSTMVLGSTRKFAHGPMQRLLDENLAKTFIFCIWEVMEPWPIDVIEQNRIKDIILRKYGNLDILPSDLTKFNGFYKWRDLINRVGALDEDVFRAQVLCEKPESGGLIYPKFDEILNDAPNFIIDTQKQIQIWEDFGYAKPDHPNAIGFVDISIQEQSFTIFDDLYFFEMTTQDIIIGIIQKLQILGLVKENLKSITREELLTWKPVNSNSINYAEFFTKVAVWIPDYHNLTAIADRRKYGCPIPDPPKVTHESLHPNCGIENCSMKDIVKMYLKENGIPHVRNFVDERRMKMVMKNCPDSRNDFLAYSKKRLQNGIWSDEVEKKNDHSCDYVHYGTVYNWPNLAYIPFDREEYKEPSDTLVDDPKTTTQAEMETTGLWGKKF